MLDRLQGHDSSLWQDSGPLAVILLVEVNYSHPLSEMKYMATDSC